ncbi:hypothetical protein DUI87_02221 [Hirundo rustica rustica]|uniref:ribonuclease H n=1 Tax=Hirundo rustica rustica TaxID=333673 RepID=A0A3M0L778_HIRRU|nr:hypothetical protein DUI87_02221 [Hirundo rustica rustica]
MGGAIGNGFLIGATVMKGAECPTPSLRWLVDRPIWENQWPLPHDKLVALRELIQEQLDQGHLEPSTSPWNTPVFCIKKKSGKWRLLQDFRKINAVMEGMGTLQAARALSGVRKQFPGAHVYHYMDDILVAAPTQDELLRIQPQLLNALHSHGLQVDPEKVQQQPPWKYLGVKILERTIRHQEVQFVQSVKTLNDAQKLFLQNLIAHPDWTFASSTRDLLKALWYAIHARVHPYYVLHERSHANLPGFVAEGVNPRSLKALELWQTNVTQVTEFGRLKYVHVTVDTFSSAMWASAQTGEKARNVIAHWRQVFAVLGIPSAVKTDNGPAYTSQKALDDAHRPRAKVRVRNLVTKQCEGPYDLITMGHGVQTQPRSDLATSPYEMMFGLPLLTTQHETATYEEGEASDRKYVTPTARTLENSQLKRIIPQIAPLEFKIHSVHPGEWVLVKTWKEQSLTPQWKGPFQVLLMTEAVTRMKERGWIHASRIKGPVEEHKEWTTTLAPGDTNVLLRADWVVMNWDDPNNLPRITDNWKVRRNLYECVLA